MAKFTNKEKAAECRRELGKRRHVYARAVTDHKMEQAQADRLIGLMDDMRLDYEARDREDRPDLFAGETIAKHTNAVDLASKLRALAKLGETAARRETIHRAADLLEEFARGNTEGTSDALPARVAEPPG